MCLCEMYHMAMQDLHVHIMHIEYSTGKNTQVCTEKLILLTFSYEVLHSGYLIALSTTYSQLVRSFIFW